MATSRWVGPPAYVVPGLYERLAHYFDWLGQVDEAVLLWSREADGREGYLLRVRTQLPPPRVLNDLGRASSVNEAAEVTARAAVEQFGAVGAVISDQEGPIAARPTRLNPSTIVELSTVPVGVSPTTAPNIRPTRSRPYYRARREADLWFNFLGTVTYRTVEILAVLCGTAAQGSFRPGVRRADRPLPRAAAPSRRPTRTDPTVAAPRARERPRRRRFRRAGRSRHPTPRPRR